VPDGRCQQLEGMFELGWTSAMDTVRGSTADVQAANEACHEELVWCIETC